MKQTRIDICYPLGIFAKHMSNPGPAHIKALHHLLRYLQGTKDYGLKYVGKKKFEVRGYCDASDRQCHFSAKSITGEFFFLRNLRNNLRQLRAQHSTAEAKHIAAACSVSKEWFYLKRLLFEIEYNINITVYCDSTAAIAMIRNPV